MCLSLHSAYDSRSAAPKVAPQVDLSALEGLDRATKLEAEAGSCLYSDMIL